MQVVPGQAFDPYHVWLGIPPEEQPPNYYRLLGIGLYEGHADVIASAADRQMGHLRTFQSGSHSALSQRLLNQVAAAKICLLNPDKKTAYDRQLREQLQSPLIPSEDVYPVLEDAVPWADITEPLPSPSLRAKSGANATRFPQNAWRRLANLGPMLAVAATGVLVLIGLITAQRPNQASVVLRGEKVKAGPSIRPLHREPKMIAPMPIGNPSHPPQRDNPKVPSTTKLTEKPLVPREPAAPLIATSTQETPAILPKKAVIPSPRLIDDGKPEASESMSTKPAELGEAVDHRNLPEPPIAKKRPVPDDAVQRRIAAQLAGIDSSRRAKTPADKIKLAHQLLKSAQTSDPNEQYVMLRHANELAGQAGDVVLSIQAIEAIHAQFEINAIEEKIQSILDIAPTATKTDQIRAVYGCSQQVIAQALSAGRCELAAEVADSVLRTCQRPKGKEFLKQAVAQRDRVREYCRRDTQRQAAEDVLKDDAENAEAHLQLGRHYCFYVGDWNKGLPHLAKGTNPILQQLAKRELASPKDPNEQLRLADAWWELGQSSKGDERDWLLLRAGYWYDLARTKMDSGLTRLKADKRVEELTEIRQRHLHSDKDATRDLWSNLF